MLHPYFIGLPILMLSDVKHPKHSSSSQSLFYWITYSYLIKSFINSSIPYGCLNPYFIGLPILINFDLQGHIGKMESLNPYFIGLPILISRRRRRRG